MVSLISDKTYFQIRNVQRILTVLKELFAMNFHPGKKNCALSNKERHINVIRIKLI